MADEQKPLSLDADEWRTLIVSACNRFSKFVNDNPQLNAQAEKDLHTYLERMKVLVSAWYRIAPAVEQQAQPLAPDAKPEAAPMQQGVAGATEPKKRRGGWTKGKKRQPRSTAEAA